MINRMVKSNYLYSDINIMYQSILVIIYQVVLHFFTNHDASILVVRLVYPGHLAK